jgi:hypothetical protein
MQPRGFRNLKINLGTLKDKGEQMATFLEPRVGAKPSVSGSVVEFEDEAVRAGVKPRQVKTYVKRFLFMNGVRKNYRVFVQGKELTLQEVEVGEEKESKEAQKPQEKEPEPEKETGKAAPATEEEPQPKPKKAAAKKARKKKDESES